MASDFFTLFEEVHKEELRDQKPVKNEGVFLHHINDIDKRTIIDKLELSFKGSIVPIINEQLNRNEMIKPAFTHKINEYCLQQKYDYILSLSLFIEKFESVLHRNDINSCFYELSFLFNSFDDEDKKSILPFIQKMTGECLLTIARENYSSKKVDTICYIITCFASWITPADLIKTRELVNQEFCTTNSLDELKDIYNAGIITNEQLLNKYKLLIKDYSIYDLIREIHNNINFSMPIIVQEFIVKRIIYLYYQMDFPYIEIDNINIYNDQSFIDWLFFERDYKDNLDSKIVDEAIKYITAHNNSVGSFEVNPESWT